MDLRNVKPSGNFEDRTGDDLSARFGRFLGELQGALGWYAVRGFDPKAPRYQPPTPSKPGDWPTNGVNGNLIEGLGPKPTSKKDKDFYRKLEAELGIKPRR